MPRFRLLALPLAVWATAASAADLRVLPADVPLTGPRATQQLLVVAAAGDRATADRTAEAAFSSDNPAVAAVGADGVVRAVGDGQATVTAVVDGRSATATVRVSRTADPAVVSYRNHVLPTLTRTGCNMGACHGALAGKGGLKLSLRAYDPQADHFALTRQALGRRVDPAAPDASLLLLKATRTVRHGGGTRFETDSGHHQLLREWVAAGAPGLSAADPVVTGIAVYPAAAQLKVGDTARPVVRATYSDGTSADVTKWAKWASNNEPVAAVDEDGVVTVGGPGEAAVAALFDGQVAVCTVTSPFPATAGPTPAALPGRHNFVDDHIAAKLDLLNLPTSPPASDAVFVRRVYLDAVGVLPTAAEAAAFVADESPDKRAKLADALLGRPEYVDYWAHKWSDLFLVSTRKLPAPAAWAFYRAVRRAVADNRPWDAFARDVLTASGSNLADGLGNYYVLHKDVPELAEATAVTFLGMSINCAKCHNHPLEKWTQDQYWSFANLFSRVGLKDGRGDEVIVRALASGDALHLRTGKPEPPAPLDGPPTDVGSAADRRAYFADWLTRPDNPFFAKAVVNRVWKHLMGRGLVESDDDLRDTNPPTHPELLDALTRDFVAHKFDVKHLVRVILTSAAYQRSSEPVGGNAADDRFYSRYLARRLPAEVLHDAYADVLGVPTDFNTLTELDGRTKGTADYPPGTRAVQLPDTQLVSRFLDSFGRPARAQACSCERASDATVGQALHLANGSTLNDKLRDPRCRLTRWLADEPTDAGLVDRVFRTALSRPPTDKELATFTAVLADARKVSPQAHREAAEDVVWAVLTDAEFVFNH